MYRATFYSFKSYHWDYKVKMEKSLGFMLSTFHKYGLLKPFDKSGEGTHGLFPYLKLNHRHSCSNMNVEENWCKPGFEAEWTWRRQRCIGACWCWWRPCSQCNHQTGCSRRRTWPETPETISSSLWWLTAELWTHNTTSLHRCQEK